MLDKEEFKQKLAEILREARKSKGISQRDIENLDMGIDKVMVSRYERGIRIPEIYTLYRYSKILEVDLTDLFKEFDD